MSQWRQIYEFAKLSPRTLNLTEENKKQEPERQHSEISLSKYQNQYPKSGSFQIKTNLTKNDTQNPGISQKDTPKSGSTLKKYPK